MKAGERRWRYSAENSAGKVISGVIAAGDISSARRSLGARSLTPLTLQPEKEPRIFPAFFEQDESSLRLHELSAMTNRLRDLLAAGLPLAHVLRIAREQAESPRENVFLAYLLDDVRAGRSFKEALVRSEISTPRLFHALVEAGEALGNLDRQMDRLALHYDGALKFRRELISQLAYPLALITLMIATIFFLSFLVLPQFEGIFAASNAAPPPETEAVLSIGAFIRRFWLIFPVVLIIFVAAANIVSKRFPQSLERLQLTAPIVGGYTLNREFGAYFRMLSTLLAGGADLAKSMQLAKQTMSLSVLREQVELVENAVRTGERLAPSLSRLTSCPADLVSLTEIGEETGELARLTGQAASRAEDLVRRTLRRYMALLAPILTAFIGLLTAGVIASVMTGVLSLNDSIY